MAQKASSKIICVSVLAFVILALAAFMVFSKKHGTQTIRQTGMPSEKSESKNEDASSSSESSHPLTVSGWVPYWAKDKGIQSLEGKLDLFSEINPFAFHVDTSGNISDPSGVDGSSWSWIIKEAKKESVRVVPTILWADSEAMHETFSDPKTIEKHIDAIDAMLKKYDFQGVDIDYEGKDVADRDNFSSFLQKLNEKLGTENKTMSCIVEARTQDSVPDDLSGTRAMSFANDPKALNDYCTTVRVMAYDQVFQIHRAYQFDDNNETPNAPNADNRWVEDVMNYFLKYIPHEKLSLGIPTYGWEFNLSKTDTGYRYARLKSVEYAQALQEAASAGVEPKRTDGGELSFTYSAKDGEHIVTFEDADSIQDKMDIAKNLELSGVSFFKIDGETDPKLFEVLKNK